MSLLQAQRLRLLEKFVHTTNLLAARFGRLSHFPEHLEVGRRGEEAAYFYLRGRGYVVVARDWRSGKLAGDLDLVAWKDAVLCFVEVKARTSRKVATAESAVDEEKSRTLRRVARQYIRGLPSPPQQTRFDVLSVYFTENSDPEFQLITGAFGWYGTIG